MLYNFTTIYKGFEMVRYMPTIDIAGSDGVVVGMTMHKTNKKYAMRGSDSIYVDNLIDAVDALPKSATRLMLALIKIRGDMNVIDFKSWAMIGSEISQDRSQVTRSRDMLFDRNIIGEYNGKLFLNPFIVLPKYDKVDENNQWRSQMLWRHLFENKDLIYKELEDDKLALGI